MKKTFTLLSILFSTALVNGQDLIINEVLYDPPSGIEGDANGDGVRDANEDEFLELVNTSTSDMDLSGYTIWDSKAMEIDTARHIVPAGTIIPAGHAYIVFGGGTPTGSFGGATVDVASSGDLNMTNSGDSIVVIDAMGDTAIILDIEPWSNNPDESYTRNPDITGDYEQINGIDTTQTILFSPGYHVDNVTPFDGTNSVNTVVVESLEIFPNPASDMIVVENLEKSSILTIYAISGQIIRQETLSSTTIDVSNLNKGLYIVRVDSGKVTRQSKLIIQ